MSPLGFSDLTEDEALVVSIYRDWIGSGSSRADYEREIAGQLLHDPLHAHLTAVFAVFRDISKGVIGAIAPGPQLSHLEERLLDDLSQRLPTGSGVVPQVPERMIRPSASIKRTGLDALLSKVNATSWRVATCL
ncbi:MAG: hypothetical protein AAF577_15130 [Pseudomonadota bacterium]